jgi:SAM-dependent methyltransferase
VDLDSKLERLKIIHHGVLPPELEHGIAPFLQSKYFPSVLDAPCGHANLLEDIRAQLGGQKSYLVGLDKYINDSELSFNYDLDKPLPDVDHIFDLVVSSYGVRYLKDPVSFINESLRVLKPGGFLIMNGVSALKLNIGNDSYRDEVIFFSEYLGEDTDKIKIYTYNRDEDWVILQSIDPNYRLEFELQNVYSTIMGGTNIDIRSAAHFVYKRKDSSTRQEGLCGE